MHLAGASARSCAPLESYRISWRNNIPSYYRAFAVPFQLSKNLRLQFTKHSEFICNPRIYANNMRNKAGFINLFPSTCLSSYSSSSFCSSSRNLKQFTHAFNRRAQVNVPQAVAARTSLSTDTKPLVDKLLSLIADANLGYNIEPELRSEIDERILHLAEIGRTRNALADPKFFSNYCVSYQSARRGENPVGGKFRGSIGRILFQTQGLFQHFISPNIVVQLLRFRFLGLVKGAVSLRGTFTTVNYPELGPSVIQAVFQRPRFVLGKAVFEYGPIARFFLSTPYVDDRIRIGVAGRGTLFVFTKGGLASSASAYEWKAVWSAKTLPKRLIPITILTVVGIFVLPRSGLLFGLVVCLALALAFVLKDLGVERNSAVLRNK